MSEMSNRRSRISGPIVKGYGRWYTYNHIISKMPVGEHHEKIPDHEKLTVCVINPLLGEYKFVGNVDDNIGDVSRLLNGGKLIYRRYLHVMPITVGINKDQQRLYGALYADQKELTEDDETIVFRSTDSAGRNVYTGMPLGPVAIFTFDNRRLNKPTRPGTLSDEDQEFLRGHMFAKDGRVFLMAEARKEY